MLSSSKNFFTVKKDLPKNFMKDLSNKACFLRHKDDNDKKTISVCSNRLISSLKHYDPDFLKIMYENINDDEFKYCFEEFPTPEACLEIKKEFYDEAEGAIWDVKRGNPIYRALVIPSDSYDAFKKSLYHRGAPKLDKWMTSKEEYNKLSIRERRERFYHRRAGPYWAWDEEHAEAHWGYRGKGDMDIILKAENAKNISEDDTKYLNMSFNGEEHEIRLDKTSRVDITQICIVTDKGNKCEKLEKLKNVRVE